MSMTVEMAGSAVPGPHLSLSEKICLQLVAEGRSLPEISLVTGHSEPDIAELLSAAEEKLGAHSRLHAVSLAMLKGHIDFDETKPD